MNTRGRNIFGALCAILGGVCWGLSGSCGQFLFTHENMDVKWLVPIRLGFAGLILLIFSLLRYKPKNVIAPFKTKKDIIGLLVYGLLGVSLCQFFYFATIQLSSAAIGTILQDLAPAMILLVECLIVKRRPHVTEIIAIVLAMLGVSLITTHGQFTLSIPVSALVAGIICAVCVTVYNVDPGHVLKKFPVIILQGWSFLLGSLFFMLIFQPWQYHYHPSMIGLLGIAFVVVVGNVLAFPLYMTGVRIIGPSKSILYGFSEPVTAAIVGTLFLGNIFTLWDLLGFILIFGMLTLISLQQRKSDSI